jgi:hypothetical protein
MLTANDLTERESQIAHNLAITLVQDETDVNELGKAIAYFRSIANEPDAGVKFFKYLKTLVSNGSQIGHSRKTPGYYRSINSACKKFLQGEKANPETMLKILGWAMRLMQYYKVSPIEEGVVSLTPKLDGVSERQAEIAEALQGQKFTVGQVLEAKVSGIKGNKVTYEIFGTIKLTEKEPKKASSLSEEQTVNVEILDIKEDGSIKKVRCKCDCCG